MNRLLVTTGRGPAECRIALAGLLEVMAREARALGVDLDIVESRDPDGHGPGSAVVVASTADGASAAADVFARRWIGTLLWVAPSPVRPGHKRRNWFVACSRLEHVPVAAPPLAASDVRFETFRAGGAGGQHQNKTESAVRAVHMPTGLVTVVRSERSQHRNRAVALARLTELVRLGAVLAAAQGRREEWARHDELERGRPLRTFRGSKFEELGSR